MSVQIRIFSAGMLLAAALLPAAAQKGELAFISGTEQEDQCVCVIDAASGAIRRVGPGSRDGAPRWAPDGARIAFETKQDEGRGIYVADAAGGGALLGGPFLWNHSPAWAPDGKRLAWSADNEMGMMRQIVVHDFETGGYAIWGGGQPGLMKPVWLPTLDLMLALAPDEKLELEGFDFEALHSEAKDHGLLLAIGLTGKPGSLSTEIFLVTPSCAAPLLPILVTDSPRYAEWAVTPSRKGRRIAWDSNDGGDREIFVLDKKGISDVTNHPAADWNPVWAPDGKRLAFESFRTGRRGVYTVLSETALVNAAAASGEFACWSPAWSPDGEWLAWVSNATGNPEIHIGRPDGTDAQQLTHHPGPDLAPAWRPEK
jgi:Tol biopolymer transport system component